MNEDNIFSSLCGKSLKDIAAIIYKQSQDIERYRERESSRGFVGTIMGCPVHADLSTVDKGARAYRLGEIAKMFRDLGAGRHLGVVDDPELKELVARVEKMVPTTPLKLLLHIARKLS
jgi:hypothetical protein